VDQSVRDAEKSGDERRMENARNAAMERNFRLDMMPDDLAGKVRELQAYDFESAEAQQRFEQLMDKLRQQLMEKQFNQISESMKNMSPEDMARMKEMMKALNEMIERHNNGEDEKFEEFMEKFGDFFPENPQTFEELMEQLARQMQAAQDMLNSMTPEQRQQLQELSSMLLDDMELQNEMAQLSANMQSMFPGLGQGEGYEMQGENPMGFEQAMQAMKDLADLDRLEDLMNNPASPQQLAEADMDRVRDLLGDEVARSMDKLSKLVKEMEREGLIPSARRQAGGHAALACVRSARRRCATSSPVWPRTSPGNISNTASARGTSAPTRPSNTNTATRSTSTCSAPFAMHCDVGDRAHR